MHSIVRSNLFSPVQTVRLQSGQLLLQPYIVRLFAQIFVLFAPALYGLVLPCSEVVVIAAPSQQGLAGALCHRPDRVVSAQAHDIFLRGDGGDYLLDSTSSPVHEVLHLVSVAVTAFVR